MTAPSTAGILGGEQVASRADMPLQIKALAAIEVTNFISSFCNQIPKQRENAGRFDEFESSWTFPRAKEDF